MTGLIDCNNFFVSCERIFNPRLRERPVCVLSNNDGCIVALSNEAKALGLRRGDPYFKVKKLCDNNGVAVLSGNHRLYGDISQRVMSTIASLTGDVYVYSIDECFVDLSEWNHDAIVDTGREIVRRVRRNVGIPTSLGIASTKTLAKIASHFAKKYPAYRSVCYIDNEERRRKALALTEIGDVWGIGRRLSKRLAAYAISTAADFADMSADDIAKIVNIIGIRTWRELNGQPCIDVDGNDAHQKQMCCSRSFAECITEPGRLAEALALFATNLGRRLRAHGLAATGLTAFMQTNSFRQDMPQYSGSAYIPFDEPCNDNISLADAANRAMAKVFRRGFAYKRAGLLIPEVCSADAIQRSLFADDASRLRRARLMNAIDAINASSLTHDTVHIASYMPAENIARCEARSPYYSTRLSDIIIVKNGL